MAKKPDWQALERKLADGKSIEDAASEAGVDLGEAEKYLAEQMGKDFWDYRVLLAADKAMQVGIQKLTQIAELVGPVGDPRADQKAAETLLRFSIDARKVVRSSKAPGGSGGRGGGQRDLFDPPAPGGTPGNVVTGPWQFRESQDG